MANALAIGFTDVKNRGLRLDVGAVVATAALEMMMRVGAPNMLGISPMNPANLITKIVGLPQGHVIGAIVHYGLALIIFPIDYMIIAYRHFPGPYLLTGALWGVLLWLVAMVVVLP